MRVLFTVTGWKGVYFSLIPLGWALQAAGHEVRVACPPSQAGALGGAGLVPAPVLEDFDTMRLERLARYAEAVRSPGTFTGPPPLHPLTGAPVKSLAEFDVAVQEPRIRAAHHAVLGRNCDAAAAFARVWRPDLVVHDLMTPEGVLAARVAGVPAVFHSPGMFGSQEAALADPTGAFERHGVAPLGTTPPGQSAPGPAGAGRGAVEYTIDPTPGSIAPPHGNALTLPVRYVPYNGPGHQEPWLLEPAPRTRVCLVWSNSARNIFGTEAPVLRHAVDAVLATGAELLLTASAEQAEALGPMPGSVRVLRDFPLRLLLPGCDALIHQGSVNPMMTGLGVPQLALGLTDDGVEIGRRFSRGGSGVALAGLEATAEDIHRAVARIVGDPEPRAAAAALEQENAQRPPLGRVVHRLERLARDGGLTEQDLSD
ncbi:DUF1205 domain-containing protein [Streptomyces sp. SID11233]|uniref:nucleotide disphospho-sugar-binding domain-containing protein n=1 Tax=Streptomyces sp. SID11385 TaxID=2706031 RepID=UPI0013C2267B|nr:nucleotide disphospho-sugar-binding domain-containing protein [Streptomyces sp. SID11385]NEA44214.1 DUF1205 domain-containing protein [Streptomyces sp. SID11385]NED82329.1 DUF1205 domain-containing protein [Streptomyces sp. SID11233]